MYPEAANNDDSGSKEVKERRQKATSTVYTVDATQKTSMNGMAVAYCDDQSPLSTLQNTGRQKNSAAAAAAAAWRHCSTVQSDVHRRSSPPHRRQASNECLRRSESSSAAEVIICRDCHRRLTRDVLYCVALTSQLLQRTPRQTHEGLQRARKCRNVHRV